MTTQEAMVAFARAVQSEFVPVGSPNWHNDAAMLALCPPEARKRLAPSEPQPCDLCGRLVPAFACAPICNACEAAMVERRALVAARLVRDAIRAHHARLADISPPPEARAQAIHAALLGLLAVFDGEFDDAALARIVDAPS